MLVKGQRLGTNLAVQGLRSSLGVSWPQPVLTVARWLSNYCPACPWKEQGESLKPHSSHWVTEREAFHVSWGQGRLSGDIQNLSWELIRIKQATIKHKTSPKWTKVKEEASPSTNTTLPAVEGRERWWLRGNTHTQPPFCFHPHNPEEHWKGEHNTKKRAGTWKFCLTILNVLLKRLFYITMGYQTVKTLTGLLGNS